MSNEVIVLQRPRVAEHANQCFKSFQQCLLQASAIHPRELSRVEDQLARFSAWSAGIGVFAPGRASMDHRLRHALDVQSVVMDLLESLDYHVQNCSKVLSDISTGPQRSDLADQGLQRSLDDIAAEISRLYKISNTIRRAGKETQNLKATEFIIKDDEGHDIGPLLLGHFKRYIHDRFPDISDTLKDRLACTMLLRRKRILYRKSRQPQNLNRQGQVSPEIPVVPPAVIKAAPTPAQTPEDDTNLGAVAMNRTKVTPSQVRSATTLAPEMFRMASSTPSFVSATKTVAISNHEHLVFPPSPASGARRVFERFKARRHAIHSASLEAMDGYLLYKARVQAEEQSPPMNPNTMLRLEHRISAAGALLQDTLKRHLQTIGEITCPYCFHAFPAQDMFDEWKWQNHVKNDLDPYVCLFESCDQPEELYSHSDQWLKHMNDHAWIWRCTSHRDVLLSTRDEYISHMREAHNTTLTDTQLRVMADRSGRRRGTLFKSCPLCGLDGLDDRLNDHIVGHLRSLALKSLPAYEDEISDGSASDNGSLGTSRPRSRSTIKSFFKDEQLSGDVRAIWQDPPPDVPLQRQLEEMMFHPRAAGLVSEHSEWPFPATLFESYATVEDDPIIQSMLRWKREKAETHQVLAEPDTQETVEDDEGYPREVKCICGFSDNDGQTIFCATCLTMQHIVCYYPDQVKEAIEQRFPHSCFDCQPRVLDPNKARETQAARIAILAAQEDDNDIQQHGVVDGSSKATQQHEAKPIASADGDEEEGDEWADISDDTDDTSSSNKGKGYSIEDVELVNPASFSFGTDTTRGKAQNASIGQRTAGLFPSLSRDNSIIGTVSMYIHGAKDLPSRWWKLGKRRAYCIARVGEEDKRTRRSTGGRQPMWYKDFMFNVRDSPDYDQLKVTVVTAGNNLIGQAWIDLRDTIVPGGGQTDMWHPLTCKGQDAGRIRMRITFYDERPKWVETEPEAGPAQNEDDDWMAPAPGTKIKKTYKSKGPELEPELVPEPERGPEPEKKEEDEVPYYEPYPYVPEDYDVEGESEDLELELGPARGPEHEKTGEDKLPYYESYVPENYNWEGESEDPEPEPEKISPSSRALGKEKAIDDSKDLGADQGGGGMGPGADGGKLPDDVMNQSSAAARPAPKVSPAFEQRIGQFINDDLQLTGVLGEGAFTAVYSAVQTRTDTRYAVKSMNKFNDDGTPLDSRQMTLFVREIKLHHQVSDHPNVVKILKIVDGPEYTDAILEYCPEGDLFYNITECGRYVGDDELVKRVFLQIIDAVEHCHQRGIYHRDLTPENILVLDGGRTVKLADFGLAISEDRSSDFGCGVTSYMSPEVLHVDPLQDSYRCAPNDIWSLGIMLINLVCGRNPWSEASAAASVFRAYTKDANVLKAVLPITDELCDLLARILTVEPEARIILPELRARIIACSQLSASIPSQLTRPPSPLNNESVFVSDGPWLNQHSAADDKIQ